MNKAKRTIALLAVGVLFFEQAQAAEVVRGTVSKIREDSNLVAVSAQDPGSGEIKEFDLALLPEPGSSQTKLKSDLHAGDEVSVRLKKNGTTGMYEASVIKTGVS